MDTYSKAKGSYPSKRKTSSTSKEGQFLTFRVSYATAREKTSLLELLLKGKMQLQYTDIFYKKVEFFISFEFSKRCKKVWGRRLVVWFSLSELKLENCSKMCLHFWGFFWMTISSVLFIFIVCVGFDLDFDFNCCQIPFKKLVSFHQVQFCFVIFCYLSFEFGNWGGSRPIS